MGFRGESYNQHDFTRQMSGRFLPYVVCLSRPVCRVVSGMAAQSHPMSLAAQPCDPYIFDTNHFENLLNANSDRMLVPDNQCQIKLIEVGNRGNSLMYQ